VHGCGTYIGLVAAAERASRPIARRLTAQHGLRLYATDDVMPDHAARLLPARGEVVRQVRRLADRVHHQGGTARVLRIRFTVPGEERAVVDGLNTARDAEYAEVLDRLPALRQELAAERARGRATYAEVEEPEADLERFRAWLVKIAARDYFNAPGGQAARDAVDEAAADLAAFEQAALQAEASQPTPAHRSKRLRVVGDA